MPGVAVRAQTAPPAAGEAPSAAAVASAAEPLTPRELFTPEEERALAERDQEPAREVAGGALTTQQLTYIVIALAAAVLVLVLK
jgi:hypothetical protein